MKKYCFLCVLICVFYSCRYNVVDLESEETVTVELPKWPPETDDSQMEYPQLSRWLIKIVSADYCDEFYTTSALLSPHLPKNSPAAFTATPITLTTDGRETCFFKPAGAIYPYDVNPPSDPLAPPPAAAPRASSAPPRALAAPRAPATPPTISLSWTHGYPSSIFQTMFQSKAETGVTTEHMKEFLELFNWKKFSETIEKNMQSSINDFSNSEISNPKFYNPWLIDSSKLMENLSYKNFKSSYLNTTNIVGFKIEKIWYGGDENVNILSSFIPENQIVLQKKQISLKKGELAYFCYNIDFTAIIVYNSSKNISLEYGFMPIIKKEI